MATPKPPNLYYYASGVVNKNFEGSSIEEGNTNNLFYPNNNNPYMCSHQPFPNPYGGDPRGQQYENKSEQGNCGKAVSPILAVLFVLFFVAFLATLIVWAIMTNGFRDMGRMDSSNYSTSGAQLKLTQSNEENFCQSEDCVIVASQMLKHMDQSVNPCEDFYQFACGNYANSILLPEDKRRMSPLDEMETKLNLQLKSILEKPDAQSDSSKSSKLARTFYKSCMNMESIETHGLDPLKKLIHRLGDWPIFNPSTTVFDENNFVWEQIDANLRRKLGIESLLSLFLLEDFKDSTKRIITIDQPNLNLGSRDYYLKGKQTTVMKAYLQYMIDSVVMLGVSETEAKHQMSDVLEFEILLANITMPEEDRRDHTTLYNPTNVLGLKKDVDDIKWDDWFRLSFPSHLNVSDWEAVNVFGMNYLRQLATVLRSVKRTTISNYQVWNVIVSAVDFLPEQYRLPYLKFQQVFTGVKVNTPRWEECVGATSSFLPWPVGALYVKNFFKQDAKREMDMLVANLRHGMREQIRNADWMDQDTRRSALNKLSRMVQKIGYPEYVNNETKLLEDFEGMIELSSEDYLGNAVAMNGIKIERNLLKLRQQVDKSDWSAQPAMVNAFYSSSANEIIFPAGILQFPAFNPNAPKYINYPRIGAAIGHEITHGYDDEGRQYDQEGNLKNWWSEQTLKQFTDKSNCFISQYDNITEHITGKHLNGRLTLGENIADNGGLKVAYKAYQIWLQQHGNLTEPKLPGFGTYGPQKLFFLSYANLWCEVVRPQALDVILTIDPHTLANYRINVPLQNFPLFSEVWNCPANSRMNPNHKCSVW